MHGSITNVVMYSDTCTDVHADPHIEKNVYD